MVFTALCWTAHALSGEAGAEPNQFVPSSRARPLQVDAELSDAAPKKTPTSKRRATTSNANSRIIKRKAVDIAFVDDPEENGGPAALRWRHSIQSGAIVDNEVSQAQAISDDDSGPFLAAPALLESNDDYNQPFREDLEVALQPAGGGGGQAGGGQAGQGGDNQPGAGQSERGQIGDDDPSDPNLPDQEERLRQEDLLRGQEEQEGSAPQPLDPRSDSRQLDPMDEQDDMSEQPDIRGFDARPPRRDPLLNNRDCEKEMESCDAARQRIQGRSIRQISLDISPTFNPKADEAAPPPKTRPRDFERMERTWRNTSGEVIAEGALTGIENGRLLIRDADGEIQRIETLQLSEEDLCFFAAWWGIPTQCSLGNHEYVARSFAPSTFTWKASALCHKPLYFEEPQLERYGHTTGPIFQPILSGAHFFLNIAALPYNSGIHPLHECQYALGYYRPGDCAPWLLPPIPLSTRGALMEAGAIVGGIYVLP